MGRKRFERRQKWVCKKMAARGMRAARANSTYSCFLSVSHFLWCAFCVWPISHCVCSYRRDINSVRELWASQFLSFSHCRTIFGHQLAIFSAHNWPFSIRPNWKKKTMEVKIVEVSLVWLSGVIHRRLQQDLCNTTHLSSPACSARLSFTCTRS